MSQVLRQLPKVNDPAVLVGFEGSDDAAVYKVSDDTALISTLDFFTPMDDDPYVFGQIAAANALSDVYAMGGSPALALNIVCFPCSLGMDVLGEILRGGADKVTESGAVIIGGHSVDDTEPKYGLSVTGFVHPEKIWKNRGAQEGDVLLLTKPIGTGILNTAARGGLLTSEQKKQLILSMSTLNKYAAEAVKNSGRDVHACTDITGFGLLGHLLEMLGDDSGAVLRYDHIPLLDGVDEMKKMGMIPTGAYKNMEYLQGYVNVLTEQPVYELYDPQTSGGLLFAVAEEDAEAIMADLNRDAVFASRAIGRVTKRGDAAIVIEEEEQK